MSEIVGRHDELAVVDRFLARPLPAALLIDGEAGIGKTILWRDAIRRAESGGRRVLAASPGEAEAQLPFTALADLLAGVFEAISDELPIRQRRALAAAVLLESEERAQDRRAVAVAVLNAVRLLASAEAVVLAIDDVQWLDADSAKTLDFVLRRIADVSIGLLLARRSKREDERPPLGLDRTTIGVERIQLGGLSLGATGELVRRHAGVSLRRPTLRRIHTSSGGNPLFALGIADALVRAGPEEADEGLPLPRRCWSLRQCRLQRCRCSSKWPGAVLTID